MQYVPYLFQQSISPGACRTDLFDAAIFDMIPAVMNVEDVSNAVLFALSTPPHVIISELTIRPVGESY